MTDLVSFTDLVSVGPELSEFHNSRTEPTSREWGRESEKSTRLKETPFLLS